MAEYAVNLVQGVKFEFWIRGKVGATLDHVRVVSIKAKEELGWTVPQPVESLACGDGVGRLHTDEYEESW
jgi:hypothetical protein